ncbi:MAG: asparaginase domain-containing protein [Methylomonas sp.]
MKNILLVFTGGTIGSQLRSGVIDACASAGSKLLQMFSEQHPNARDVTFKTIQPLQILSENLHPQHWSRIIGAIEAEDLNAFDGIILTHGTDTLSFSAAALGLYFNQIHIPLLLVSSDLPLENPQANGLPNFRCAVEFICQIRNPGVFVSYQNPGQSMQVYSATRIGACLQLSSDFIGIQSKACFQFLPEQGFVRRENRSVPQLTPIKIKADFSTHALLIRPYPGLDYSHFKLDGADVVLHDLYHSGTACASGLYGEQHNLLEFIKQCRQRSLSIYLAPAIYSENAYSSTRQFLEQGAKMIWNMSLEAAYAKLLLAYANFSDSESRDYFLKQNLAGEQLFNQSSPINLMKSNS